MHPALDKDVGFFASGKYASQTSDKFGPVLGCLICIQICVSEDADWHQKPGQGFVLL